MLIFPLSFQVVRELLPFACISENHKDIKSTALPAERCDFVGVKLEKVHELFQVCRICGKGVLFYNMAQYGSVINAQSSIYINLLK